MDLETDTYNAYRCSPRNPGHSSPSRPLFRDYREIESASESESAREPSTHAAKRECKNEIRQIKDSQTYVSSEL